MVIRAVPAVPRFDFVIGMDPGPGTGIGLLRREPWPLTAGSSARAFQANLASAPWLLRAILNEIEGSCRAGRVRGGIEGFAPGHGAGAAKHGSTVSRQVEELAEICAEFGVPLQARHAALAKNWATDTRLKKAGLYDITAGGTHSRDSMRHALMTAVQDCGWLDPLSKRTA
jgi:hypothetical protein